jgi:diamine N-acetyltransferase
VTSPSNLSGNEPQIRLVRVDEANAAAVAALELGADQAHFVATNAQSLSEAADDPDARPRAITAGQRLVGFLMYEAPQDEDEATIYRFMIAPSSQGRGYGRAALQAVLDEIESLGHVRKIAICYEPDNLAARHLYLTAGFREEGLDEDGEMIACLALTASGEIG